MNPEVILPPNILAQQFDLADPKFDKPGKVDLLLGQDIYTKIGSSIRKEQNTCLTETILGWIIGGIVPISAQKSAIKPAFLTQLDRKHFEKFWHIEDLPICPEAKYSSEELECVHHYDTTTTFGHDGRPIVRLPLDKTKTFTDPKSQEIFSDIGHSARKALGQFLHNERKLTINDSARQQYVEFFEK